MDNAATQKVRSAGRESTRTCAPLRASSLASGFEWGNPSRIGLPHYGPAVSQSYQEAETAYQIHPCLCRLIFGVTLGSTVRVCVLLDFCPSTKVETVGGESERSGCGPAALQTSGTGPAS